MEQKKARTWNLETRKPLGPPIPLPGPTDQTSTREFVTLEFSSDGALVLTTNNRWPGESEASSWEAKTGKLAGPPIHYESVQSSISAAFRHDGKVVAVRGKDEGVRLFDSRTGRALCDPIHPEGGIWSVAFSPDGQRLLTGENKGTVQIRDSQTGHPIGLPLQNPVKRQLCFAAFSRDGRSILALEGEFAWLWDTTSNLIRATVELENIATNQLEPFETGGLCVYKDMLHPILVDISTGRSVTGWHYHRMDGFASGSDNKGGFRWYWGSRYTAAFDATRSNLLYAQKVRNQRFSGLWRLQPVQDFEESHPSLG